MDHDLTLQAPAVSAFMTEAERQRERRRIARQRLHAALYVRNNVEDYQEMAEYLGLERELGWAERYRALVSAG